ncbi:MAG TPA: glycosyltransferase family 4 protein [Candidatus Polarisedimenticolia bacterium]|nr:glycosyltransferase family 4 protein [Candidatus Polarisedimenticolia bacterium]
MSEPLHPAGRPPRLHIGFRTDVPAGGGGGGANQRAARALREAFDVRDALEEADLQIRSFSWEAPETPARLFLDHGSFADASFWAYTSRSLRPGDTILVASEVCVQIAARLLRPGSVQILKVPLPIDRDRFLPSRDRGLLRREIAAAHGIPVDGPLLLVVAAFVRRKNHHHALDLLAALRRSRPDCRLAFVGTVPDRDASRRYREQIEARAAEGDLEGAVHFLEALPAGAVARLMAASDALVHLSTCRLENFGLVVAEAAASGLPVLAADWGGLRDIVRDGVTGHLAPTWLSDRGPRVDWRALVAPALELLERPQAWRVMSDAARAMAESELALETHATRLRAAVASALAWSRGSAGPVEWTPDGQELAFRTIALNAAHPEIKDTGDEFRLLVPLEGGRYYRLLAGPAASFDRTPRVRPEDRLAAIVRWRDAGDGIDIDDPVWPSRLELDPAGRKLLGQLDGRRTLGSLLGEIAGSPGETATLEATAQRLADAGLVGTGSPLRPKAT